MAVRYIKMIKLIKRNLRALKSTYSSKKVLGLLSSDERSLVKKIKDSRLTYLSDHKLCSIIGTLNSIKNSGVPGSFIEAGCALGGSAILIGKLGEKGRALRVYDVFGMIPPPTEEDTDDVHDRYKSIVEGNSTGLGGDKYYGYEDNLYEKVVDNFKTFGLAPKEGEVELIKGLVQDTLHVTEPVALAHIDVDWYEPVMTCLERIYPMLSVGGAIILDDYHAWGGCRKATDEFLRGVAGSFTLDNSSESLKITKIK